MHFPPLPAQNFPAGAGRTVCAGVVNGRSSTKACPKPPPPSPPSPAPAPQRPDVPTSAMGNRVGESSEATKGRGEGGCRRRMQGRTGSRLDYWNAEQAWSRGEGKLTVGTVLESILGGVWKRHATVVIFSKKHKIDNYSYELCRRIAHSPRRQGDGFWPRVLRASRDGRDAFAVTASRCIASPR